MPSARSRLADIEGAGLGKPLIEPEIISARADLITALLLFLKRVDASDQQVADAHAFLADTIFALLALSPTRPRASSARSHTIVPIRLRENVTILVQGLPADLSLAEAAKIAAVIKAFASPKFGDAIGAAK